MNLDSILADLEKKAGFPDEDKDKADKEKADKEKAEKEKTAKSTPDEQEKSAAFKEGSAIAREIMEKIASVNIKSNTNKGEDNMNKQASDAGKALAQALLKQAGIGDTNTSNGIPAGVVPNKSQRDQAAQKAEHDLSFQATPGTDGLGNGGTINEIFDAIVSDAFAKGAKDEQVSGNYAAAEGAQVARQVPSQVQTEGPEGLGDTQEKMAAAITLVNAGYDFDDAVSLVKSASDALEYEHGEHVKQAAFNELIDAGVNFEDAANLIKQAGAREAFNAVKGSFSHAASNAKRLVNAPSPQIRKHHMSQLASNGVVRTGAGMAAAGAVAGGAHAITREKSAAVSGLVENGVDFDTAVDLVNQKSYEIYGC